VSHYRRTAVAGLALAIAGVFITAPAQAATAAATATVQHAAQASTDRASATRAAARPDADESASAGYKSFSSSAKTAGRTTVAVRPALPQAAKPAASSGTVVYVEADPTPCTTEVGEGTYADPYCLLQSAVDNAVSGDTIEVYQEFNEQFAYHEPIVVNGKSDLTIIGEVVGAGDTAPNERNALEIENSTDITVDDMVLESENLDTVAVYQSSDVTLNGDSLLMDAGPYNALTIGAGDTDVSVTRSALGDNGGGVDVSVVPGAQNVVLASDVMSSLLALGVSAGDVSTLDIVGDTFDRGCGGALGIGDDSTGVSIENNVFEAGTVTAAFCSSDQIVYGPVVTVDSTSTPSTTTDYNDFNFSADGTAAYDWAGTTYPTLAAFQTAVPQAAHDLVDPNADAEMFLSPAGMDANGVSFLADAVPVTGAASIDSANTAAPGYLPTDFYGRDSYTDRGALEYVSPGLTAALSVYQTGARTVEADAHDSVEPCAYATYTYNWGDGTATSAATTSALVSHVYASPGTYTVTITVTDVFGDTSSAEVSAQTAGSDYVPLTPTRVLDTRKGIGTGGTIAPLGSGQTLILQVAGVSPVPTDASAVAVNLTVTDAVGGGYLDAYPAGTLQPSTSNVNFGKGKTVANLAVVSIGAGGDIDLYNGGSGTIDVVGDVAGYFVTAQADGYRPLTPTRLLDTRTGVGGHDAPLTPADPVRLKVAGVGGVPADAKAVQVNLTVAAPSLPSYVTAYPDGGTKPATSSVNFAGGETIANAAIVQVGSDGYIDVALAAGSTRMVVDVDGYFSANAAEAPSAYEPADPYRYLDTRTITNGALPAGYYYYL
jgi:hypothetical protein